MFVNLVIKDFITINYKDFVYYFFLYFCNYGVEYISIPIIFSILITILKKNTKLKYEFTLNIFKIFRDKYIYSIITIILLLYLFNYNFLNNNVNYTYNKLYSKLFAFVRIKLNKNLLDKKKINFKDIDVCKDLVSLDLSSNYIVSFMDIIFVRLITLLIFTTIILVLFLSINVDIFLVFIICIFVILIYILKNKNKIIKKAIKKEETYLEMIKNSENAFANLSNLLINNKSNFEIKKNTNLTNKFKRYNMESYECLYNIILNCRIIYFVFKFIILLFIFKNYGENKISLQFLIALIFIFNNYSIFYKSSIYDNIMLYKYAGQIEVTKKNFDMIINNKLATNNYKIKLGKIEFRNIQFKYTDKLIFNNLNLIIQPKEKLAIIGKSGSGKSTLIKLLLRFYPIESGNILVDNIQIDKYNLYHLRQNIYYINQNTNLFNESVYYNIAYGLNEHSSEYIKKRIDTFLKNYDLYNIFSNLEGGLNSISGPNGSNLSLGMQKIVLLVRGLLAVQDKNSKVVVFDEPLTALDKKSRVKVIKMIMKECSEKTLIVITHDHEIIPHVDRVVNLKDL